ncbi:hypothetical protein [Spirosoma areae]
MKILAYIEIEGEILPLNGGPLLIKRAEAIPGILAETFLQEWNAGVMARNQWEQFCENLFQILTKSGLIDENGLHTSEYTPGSICRFLLANKEMFSRDFRDSALGMMVMSAIKTGAKTIKKGKDIEVNWDAITAHAGPMTEAVLTQLVKQPHRSAIVLPIIRQYFPAQTTPAADNFPTPSDN